MSPTISILVVDDHALVRDALVRHLQSAPDIEVVGNAADADAAVASAVKLRPALVLMDIDMPGVLCFAAARAIQMQSRRTRIAFLSAFFNDRYIEEALAVKAVGYITKAEPLDTVIDAVRLMGSGRSYFSPEVLDRIVMAEGCMRLAAQGKTRVSTLTGREVEILRYIARGMGQKEIAQAIHVTPETVHTHAKNLMKKLEIHDRVELTRFAIREGLSEA